MAKQSSAEKAGFWKLAIAEQGQSGISIKAFCQQQSLSEPSFHAWKRKLREHSQLQKPIPLTPVRVISAHDQMAYLLAEGKDFETD